MEVYLRGRHDPLQCVGSFYFNREHLNEDDPAGSFMGIVATTFRSAIFDRSQPLLILSDRRNNTFLVETSEIQAVSVLAPSPKTIEEAIERSEETE